IPCQAVGAAGILRRKLSNRTFTHRGQAKLRRRFAIIGAFAVGLTALAWPVWVAIQHRPAVESRRDDKARFLAQPVHQHDDLSVEDETALRATVSEHRMATARWAPGGSDPYDPFRSFRVLVLPRGVGEIYDRKPVGTLRILK